MLLSMFLDYILRTKQLPSGIVFCFSSSRYSLIFFYHLILFFKNNNVIIETLNCSYNDNTFIKNILSTVSLSGVKIYYLENFTTLSTKKQQDLFDYLKHYKGPHRILLFAQNMSQELMKSSDGLKTITFSEEVSLEDYSAIRALINPLAYTTTFVSQLKANFINISLDNACLFAHYELLLGKGVEDFFTQWMVYLIEPNNSFFTLSQYFFNKKSRLFFKQWSRMIGLYMSPFWVTFWADYLWRAYIFCSLMKQKEYTEAKKAQYKLPFSFINRDWTMYSLDELCNAHNFLLKLDFQYKNGWSEIGLEHFYIQFFNNKFKL